MKTAAVFLCLKCRNVRKNMAKWLISMQYDGLYYKGFQRLKDNEKTIQGIVEQCISESLSEKIVISGSGRTDSGVGALSQTATFKYGGSIDMSRFVRDINSILPNDIRINSIREVPDTFHARYSAVSKTYRYRIFCGEVRDVFGWRYYYEVNDRPDTEMMRTAAKSIVGTHDFRAFSSVKDKEYDTVRCVNRIDVCENGNIIDVIVEGNGFLYNMVRIIAGTLLDYSYGRITLEDIELAFKTGDRKYAGKTLPPNALTLIKVKY